MMKKIIDTILVPFKVTARGFYNLSLLLSRGFYFYFYKLFSFLEKIFHLKIFEKIKNLFKKLQNSPSSFLLLVLVFIVYVLFLRYGYASDDDIIYIKDDSDGEVVDTVKDVDLSDNDKMILNLYRKFGSYKKSDINFSNLKKENEDVVSWIIVDGTTVNYPVLKANDNSYYLTHDFNKEYSIGGWIFMDYRNSSAMDNRNTIIYGHNLINNTAFGSLSNLFTEKWFNNSNHKINIYTEDGNYTYEIFSVYYRDAESYYLNTNFSSDTDYIVFLKTLKSRSIYNFDVDFTSDDKIITLSTCTDDNNGRKVVHAKLIK